MFCNDWSNVNVLGMTWTEFMAKNEAKVDSRLLLLPQRVMQMITDPNISFTDDELDLLVAVDVSALFEKSNKELKVCFHVFVI